MSHDDPRDSDVRRVGPTPDDLRAYLVRTRWFGGKGRPFEVTGVRVVGDVPGRAIESRISPA